MTATVALLASAALAGCVTTTPLATTPAASAPVVASPTTLVVSTAPSAAVATPSAVSSLAASASPSASLAPSPVSSPSGSPAQSQLPVTTPVPGSSLDPSLSDAGVAGRLTLPNDTRNGWTGTHEILGRAADGSDCSYSFDGDVFTAVAWFDAAPNGMLHQMAVSVPTDEMPGNDGEQRAGITDGRVYADFASESGFGTAYLGDATEDTDPGSSTIDIAQTGDTFVFSFTGKTWDDVEFSGQMMCSGMGD